MKFNDVEYTKEELLQYIGSIEQIAGVKEYRFSSGKAHGTKGIDVKSGSGLNFTVLPDRGMDIANSEFMGIPFAWISKNKIVSSKYFETDNMAFLRNFTGGLLTTCGLTHVGEPCEDGDEKLGLHGRISNTPAERYNVFEHWKENDYVVEIVGYVRETRLYGENTLLIRSIKSSMNEPKITIKDRIINEGYEDVPLMVLYHCNFGFPLVTEKSKIFTSAVKVLPENKEAEGKDFSSLDIPKSGYKYELYNHINDTSSNKGWGAIINEDLNLGTYVKFDTENLTYFYQWKQLAKQDYVIGLEPANCLQEGRASAKLNKRVCYLKPGEEKCFEFEIGLLKNNKKIEEFLQSQ